MSKTQNRKRARKPERPGKARQAAHDRMAKAAKAAIPYAAGLGVSVIAAAVTRDLYLAAYGAGVVSGIGTLRGWDAAGWHRQGGRAAARRRRRFQGTATAAELHRTLSLRAARRRARITRPSLGGERLPRPEAGVVIGRGGRIPGTLTGSFEDFYAIFGGPRRGKTLWLAGVLHGFPGPAMATSTRIDMWAHTVHARRGLAAAHGGRVLVLNPGGDGLIGSDFAWSPLAGCHLFPRACDAAGYLMSAAPKDPGGADAWIDHRGGQLLRVMLHAAALAGADMMTVLEWCRHPGSSEPMSVLAWPGADPQAAASLAAILEAGKGRQLEAVITTADTALSWLADPVMRRAACPPDGAGLDVWDFLETRGTVYLVGQDKPHNAVTAYFRCFAGYLFDRARQHASVQPGARLDPPLGLVIDEPAITCRVPLDSWSAEAGGHGITVATGFQSFAQLPAGWGEHGGQVIRDNAVKIIMGGFAGAELEDISAACGDRDTWHHVTGPGGAKTKQPATERLFPPERIRALRDGDAKHDPQALLLYRSARPVTITVPRVFSRPGYQRAATGFGALTRTAAGPQALDAARPRQIEAPPGAGEGSS